MAFGAKKWWVVGRGTVYTFSGVRRVDKNVGVGVGGVGVGVKSGRLE